MNYSLAVAILILFVSGCNKAPEAEPYTPREPTPEEQELIQELSAYSSDIKAALEKPGDYVQIAVIDRNDSIEGAEGESETYSRVLVLHREVLDLDDYGMSLPGKESSENESDYIPGFFGELMFWVDADANIILEEGRQPPGTLLVVEWEVPNSAGDKVSLHFGGNPCLVLDLSE